MKKIYFLIGLLASSFSLLAQNTLPPNQPEQSSCDPLVICGPTFTSPYSYTGIGTRNDLTNTPCSGGEANSVWLKLVVNTPGTIVFTLTPVVATDDYDMAIVNATNVPCDQLTSANVIRCNYNNNSPGSNVNGAIGLNATSLIQFVTGGSFGNSYLQQITAAAGDVYLIMLNNFGYYTGNGVLGGGFTIDFTGSTATFNQPLPPALDHILPYCDLSQRVTVKTNQRIKCSSIAADGSDFFLTPSGTILSAVGTNCNIAAGGYTDEIVVTFTGTLPNGFYDLNARVGTDGNSLLNLCDGGIILPNKVPFQVGNNPIKIAHLDTPACQFLKITLNSPIRCGSISTNFSEFSITGPSSVGISSVVGAGCSSPTSFTNQLYITLANPIAVDGVYSLNIGNGTDNNTLIDSCGRSVPIGEKVNFTINSFNGKLRAMPENLKACYFGEQIDLNATVNAKAPSGGFNYEWVTTNPIVNRYSAATQATMTDIVNYFVCQTVDTFGCLLRDSVEIIVKPFTIEITPDNTIVCDGEEMIVEATGGETFNWTTQSGSVIFENPTSYKTGIDPALGLNVIEVTAKDDRGCTATALATINVLQGPTMNVSPKDTSIKLGETVKLIASGAKEYLWYPYHDLNNKDLPMPLANPKEDTWYTVTGWNEYGCKTIDSVLIRVLIESNPFMPNAFSPNGDGLNDEFHISNFKYERLLVFKIFDRYGKQVFETSNKDKGWDGKYENGKDAPAGVYYYYIEYAHQDLRLEKLKGDITLLR